MGAMGVSDPLGAARKAISGLIWQDARILAFGDGFALMTLGCLFGAAIALMAKPPSMAQLQSPYRPTAEEH